MPLPLPAGETVVKSNSTASRTGFLNRDARLSPTLSRLKRGLGAARLAEQTRTTSSTSRFLSPSRGSSRSEIRSRLDDADRKTTLFHGKVASNMERLSRAGLKKQFSFDAGSSPRISNFNRLNFSESLNRTPEFRSSGRRSSDKRQTCVRQSSSSDEGGLFLNVGRSNTSRRGIAKYHSEQRSVDSVDTASISEIKSSRESSLDSTVPLPDKTMGASSATKTRRRRSIPKSASDSIITCPVDRSSAFFDHIRKPGWIGLICQIPVSVYSTSIGFEVYVDYDETEILRTVKEQITKR